MAIDLTKKENKDSESKLSSSNEQFANKQKMFSNPFSFHGRIRRLEYGLSVIIIYVYAVMIGVFLDSSNSDSAGVLYLILLIPLYWFAWAQGAKRCHDRDNSGWYQIIPFYGLWMLFADGDPYENDYGPDPKGRDMYA